MSETDCAYLAGIIDGEGYIGVEVREFRSGRPGRTPGVTVVLSIANNDHALMEWLTARFDAGVVRSRGTRAHRDTYHFKANGARAGVILRAALPYLILKRPHAELALRLIDSRSQPGVRGYPPDVRRERFEIAAALQALTDKAGRRRRLASDVLALLP